MQKPAFPRSTKLEEAVILLQWRQQDMEEAAITAERAATRARYDGNRDGVNEAISYRQEARAKARQYKAAATALAAAIRGDE
jgi:hypothetical protein